MPVCGTQIFIMHMDVAGRRLIAIKLIHTIIWVFFNTVLFYMAYAVVVNRIGIFFWIGIACIVLEWVVLLIFKMACPLTILARRYSGSQRDNFDIYLPNWLAKYNKPIYTALFIIIMAGLLFRILKR